MKFLKISLATMLAAFALNANAQENPLWTRYPAISPDGKSIAFSYKGDIYKVSADGGVAQQLTTNEAHDYAPVWSPDGKTIAFASNRYGNFDIFTMPAEGGEPTRLTYWSLGEKPLAFSNDGKTLYIETNNMADKDFAQSPEAGFQQVYAVPVTGGRPELFSSVCMESISFNSTGDKLIYQDKKGYEDNWRKHHTSSVTRDIWLYEPATGKHTMLSDFNGEDMNAVFVPGNDDEFYWLSEKSGSFNIWKHSISTGKDTQVTRHETHPVRFLSISDDGTMAYFYDGEIYTVKDGAEPVKVSMEIRSDRTEPDYIVQYRSAGVSSMAVSPSGKEVAFIMRGDVYVASTEYGTTVRITDTPEQERDIDFSPDGRSIVYSAERNGCWNVYMSEIVKKDETMFTYATEIEEKPVTEGNVARFQPSFSPDGKEVAFLEARTTLRVINLKSGKIRTILDGNYNYSYSDGDQWYQWSPDGKWFAVNFFEKGGWNYVDLGLVKADGSGELHNLTESGYSDSGAHFVLDGNAILWYTDKNGYRSHGSWGSYTDIYIMFFNKESYDSFMRDKEEGEVYAMMQEASKKNKKDDKKDKDSTKADLPEVEYDFDNIEDRMVRLTVNSATYGDCYLNNDGSKLYYLAAFEGGYDLWTRDLKEGDTRLVAKLNTYSGMFDTDETGNQVYILSSGRISSLDLNSGMMKPVGISAEFNYRPALEREYIFNHAWQQVVDKFYDPDIHGIDWAMYKEAYSRFLPYINNNFDFSEMLSELLGELNASHTGSRFYNYGGGDATAVFGVFFDNDYEGDGLMVAEVIEDNPMISSDSKIKPGVIIEKIDGNPVKAGEDYYRFLNHKAGKNVVLALRKGGKTWEEVVKPISYGTQQALLYDRWVKQREHLVDSLSGGRVGYVHVQGMDSPSFREVFSKALGKYRNCDALIVDTRFNGGGWLHDDLATFLNGKHYADMTPRGQYIGSEPLNKWYKPSCVIVGEGNYSDAHGFPFAYRALGIGKIIGMPVPGTMTAVWWESQIDPTLIFGIPQIGMKDNEGKYQENKQLNPDIMVRNDPESLVQGRDLQIEAAVKEMLREIEASDAE